MKDLLRTLASLKLAVLVLALLLLALGAGTVVETLHGAEEAGANVYRSWWLFGLLQLLAASVLASVYLLYPWGKRRWGFAATHLGVALILCGSAITYRYGVDGELFIWKGESSNEVTKRSSKGRVLESVRLPFQVKLDDFRVENYPGTEKPAGYRSEIQIDDPTRGNYGASIWMNHGLSHGGWDFYQSSYRFTEDGRTASVLSASNDPGRLVVYLGYTVLLIGMGLVIFTRITERRQPSPDDATAAKGRRDPPAIALAGVVVLSTIAGAVYSTGNRQLDEDTEALRRLPVQHDGRVMPFDTLARESVRTVTGSARLGDEAPISTALDWLKDPEATTRAAVIRLDSPELNQALSIPPGKQLVSLVELEKGRTTLRKTFMDYQSRGGVPPKFQSAIEKLDGRLRRLQEFAGRTVLRSLAPAEGSDAWTVPQAMDRESLLRLVKGPRLAHWPAASTIEREITYNRVQPTRLSWIVLLGAFLLSAIGWVRREPLVERLSLAGLILGTAIMTWGLGVRWLIAGRIPASDMHESLLFLAWGVGFLALLLYPWMKNRMLLVNASGLSAVTMMLNNLLPIDPFIHPMPPVLAGTAWLAIHVPIIMLSYSILALGVVVAHVQLATEAFAPTREEVVQQLYRTLYWYIHVGCWLLAAGIISGSVWAASSWGRYWGWDPKEVWSLVALLAYLAILHGRIERIVGAFGVAAFSILAFQTILMTYLGVNFVLSTGMHSYAMGDSPVARWMLLVATVELTFLLAVVALRRRRAQKHPPREPAPVAP